MYATFFACDGVDHIGASARDFGHAVVYQFGRMGGDFSCLLMMEAVSAKGCIAEVETSVL